MNRRGTCLYRVSVALLMALLSMGMKQASAQGLDFALDQNTLTGAQGTTVSYVSLLSNLEPADQLSLDSGNATFNFVGSGLTLVDNFGATPLTLDPAGSANDSWTGVLFRVLIGGATPVGAYSGSYEITFTDLTTAIGGARSQNFTVSVTAAPVAVETPEPGTIGLGLGLATTVCFGARHRIVRRSHRVRP